MGAAHGNIILGNSIYDNDGLGIGLDYDVVTTNDWQDADTGPNGLQNFPVITAVSNSGMSFIVSGTLNSTPNHDFWLEYFGGSNCDVSGHGEGAIFLGRSIGVKTDGSGSASFTNSALLLPSPPPNFITMTATDSNTWNTSEFSAWVMLDSDGDGMPDGYEAVNFGSATGGDPNGDNDGDKVLNRDEFLADTSPTNAASYPAIESIFYTATGRAVVVRSSMHREYSVETGRPENPGSWALEFGYRDGINGSLTFLDNDPPVTTLCYRARARLPVWGN